MTTVARKMPYMKLPTYEDTNSSDLLGFAIANYLHHHGDVNMSTGEIHRFCGFLSEVCRRAAVYGFAKIANALDEETQKLIDSKKAAFTAARKNQNKKKRKRR